MESQESLPTLSIPLQNPPQDDIDQSGDLVDPPVGNGSPAGLGLDGGQDQASEETLGSVVSSDSTVDEVVTPTTMNDEAPSEPQPLAANDPETSAEAILRDYQIRLQIRRFRETHQQIQRQLNDLTQTYGWHQARAHMYGDILAQLNAREHQLFCSAREWRNRLPPCALTASVAGVPPFSALTSVCLNPETCPCRDDGQSQQQSTFLPNRGFVPMFCPPAGADCVAIEAYQAPLDVKKARLITTNNLSTLCTWSDLAQSPGLRDAFAPGEQPDVCRRIDLVGLDRRFPREILAFDNLEHLDLAGSGLVNLPSAIARLRKLKTLDVGGNELADLPFEVVRLYDTPGFQLNAFPNPFLMPPRGVGEALRGGWGSEGLPQPDSKGYTTFLYRDQTLAVSNLPTENDDNPCSELFNALKYGAPYLQIDILQEWIDQQPGHGTEEESLQNMDIYEYGWPKCTTCSCTASASFPRVVWTEWWWFYHPTGSSHAALPETRRSGQHILIPLRRESCSWVCALNVYCPEGAVPLVDGRRPGRDTGEGPLTVDSLPPPVRRWLGPPRPPTLLMPNTGPSLH